MYVCVGVCVRLGSLYGGLADEIIAAGPPEDRRKHLEWSREPRSEGHFWVTDV